MQVYICYNNSLRLHVIELFMHTHIFLLRALTGKYIPELAELIVDKNKDPSLSIDLRGILVCSSSINKISLTHLQWSTVDTLQAQCTCLLAIFHFWVKKNYYKGKTCSHY